MGRLLPCLEACPSQCWACKVALGRVPAAWMLSVAKRVQSWPWGRAIQQQEKRGGWWKSRGEWEGPHPITTTTTHTAPDSLGCAHAGVVACPTSHYLGNEPGDEAFWSLPFLSCNSTYPIELRKVIGEALSTVSSTSPAFNKCWLLLIFLCRSCSH